MNHHKAWLSISEMQQAFSNYMSLSFETDGFSPLVGKIFALLLFSPEPLSLQEMADRLGVTKAAISVQVRALEKHAMCQKLPTSSDRKDYYYIADDFSTTVIRNTVHKMKLIQERIRYALESFNLMTEVQQEERAAYDAAKLRFMEMNALYQLIMSRFDGMEEEWAEIRERLVRELEEKK